LSWERWNLKQDPFDPKPLESVEELDNLFVGREGERAELKSVLASPGIRDAVEADAGVGKTTFVNKVFSELIRKQAGFLIVPKTIKIESLVAGAEVKCKVAAELVATLRSQVDKKHEKIVEKLVDEGRKLEIAIWSSIPLFPIGGSISIKKEEKLSFGLLSHKAEDIIYKISDLLPELGFKSAVIAINNLDALPENSFNEVLNELRDFIYTPKNISFVLLANLGFYDFAQSRLPRWEGVLSAFPIQLKKFSRDEIIEIVERRINFYAVPSQKPVNPIQDELMSYLCELADGNLRWVLSTLGGLAARAPSIEDKITLEIARPILVNRANQRLARLTPAEQKIILALAKYGRETYSADKKFQEISKTSQGGLSQLFTRLESKGELNKRQDMRKICYSLIPDYKILGG